MSTAYHAKYFAYELTKRCASDSMEKLAASLADAQVDLNPHQVEAALFAFRSPLSKGAILADEVGLGKTIEAGILLSQRWAERKRKILIIVPASLRKQWHQELSDKFFLPSVILETKTFNQQIRDGNLNPFDRSEIVHGILLSSMKPTGFGMSISLPTRSGMPSRVRLCPSISCS
jgi:SNF2 family DNA or RNA helicase